MHRYCKQTVYFFSCLVATMNLLIGCNKPYIDSSDSIVFSADNCPEKQEYQSLFSNSNYQNIKSAVMALDLNTFVEDCISFTSSSPDDQQVTLKQQLVNLIPSNDYLFAYAALPIARFEFSTSGGTHFSAGSNEIAVNVNNIGVIAHEAHHAFAWINNSVKENGAVEEGVGVALAKIANGDASVDLMENIYGTKLYYRDIGVPNWPREFPWGSYIYTGSPKQPLRDLATAVANYDSTNFPLFNLQQMDALYESNFECLNRDVEWGNWLEQVEKAKTTPCRGARNNFCPVGDEYFPLEDDCVCPPGTEEETDIHGTREPRKRRCVDISATIARECPVNEVIQLPNDCHCPDGTKTVGNYIPSKSTAIKTCQSVGGNGSDDSGTNTGDDGSGRGDDGSGGGDDPHADLIAHCEATRGNANESVMLPSVDITYPIANPGSLFYRTLTSGDYTHLDGGNVNVAACAMWGSALYICIEGREQGSGMEMRGWIMSWPHKAESGYNLGGRYDYSSLLDYCRASPKID